MTNSSTPPNWILPLNSIHADLPNAGGKGANLSRLARAGFPVPPGFILNTAAYRGFIAANHLEGIISGALVGLDPADVDSVEQASKLIRSAFSEAVLPADLQQVILEGYAQLAAQAVAVRSSATAEDLPDMSFAGQQDTFLNVTGSLALLAAIVQCWSSLWTARAMVYRIRNQVDHSGVSLAVIVQTMVASQASGVLFTANPLTGMRGETVIDATFGLGEALVAGQVEPDHYVVNPVSGKIVSKALGSKIVSIHGKGAGGTEVITQNRSDLQALADVDILKLANLGNQVADLFNFPQDIEWAWADDRLYILQSRPITSLYPLPDHLPVEPLKVLFSFGAVQGMLDPITPLGRDMLREAFATGASLFGIHVNRNTQSVLYEAGERLWGNFTPIVSNSIGRRVIPTVLSTIEPTIRQAVESIWDDPRLLPVRSGISLKSRIKLARFFIPIAANVFMNMIAPRQRRKYIIGYGEKILEQMEKECESIQGNRWERLARVINLLTTNDAAFVPSILILFISGVAAGMASWNLLNMLVMQAVKGQAPEQILKTHDLVMQITRGIPNNPTTEMDLALWEIAKAIRQDSQVLEVFQKSNPAGLTKLYQQNALPKTSQQAIAKFLQKYGGRGLGEIDLGRIRWADDPAHVFEMISSFLRIEEDSKAPDVVFARGAEIAMQTVIELVSLVRNTRHGWIKARLVSFLAGRARRWMGARESPKFFIVRLMGLIQHAILLTGQEFVQAGVLQQKDDLMFLTNDELQQLNDQHLIITSKTGEHDPTIAISGKPQDDEENESKQSEQFRRLISTHRQAYQQELKRRQIPRLLLSDGRAFYEGLTAIDQTASTLTGSPVSPGSAQGRVRVVLDPGQAHLQPGEILVCPGTDPSWTPLFLSAAGLVMEVGGMMTHGAVVAREYGIPAIVGVDKATQRLQTGQLIRINGSNGQIEILDDPVTLITG